MPTAHGIKAELHYPGPQLALQTSAVQQGSAVTGTFPVCTAQDRSRWPRGATEHLESATVTKEQPFKRSLILIYLNLNSHTWLVATMLTKQCDSSAFPSKDTLSSQMDLFTFKPSFQQGAGCGCVVRALHRRAQVGGKTGPETEPALGSATCMALCGAACGTMGCCFCHHPSRR